MLQDRFDKVVVKDITQARKELDTIVNEADAVVVTKHGRPVFVIVNMKYMTELEVTLGALTS